MVCRAGCTRDEGFVTRGASAQGWLRGRLMVEDGQVVGDRMGQYILRGKNTL